MAVVLASLEPLIAYLRGDGYTVIGPTVGPGAIELGRIENAADLPHGWAVGTGPGQYRLRRRTDRAAFGHSAGPQSWKTFLHPPREPLVVADRDGDEVTFSEPEDPPPRYAFLGVRPCDLRAIRIQDRVLGSSTRYAQRRRDTLIVALNCTEPGATCFCVSAGGGSESGGGPEVDDGFDLGLTELTDGADDEPRYVVTTGSPAGRAVLAALSTEPAGDDIVARARQAVSAAAEHMGRSLPEVDLRRMLANTLEAPRWEQVASRCLACANCTMVCPTCFCTSVSDTTDLTGDHTERWQRWASCFEADYSYIHGGAIRPSTRSRYRQWLTHKLGTWHDQFGESGCVGCGRCITWCPVGIDITEEANMLALEAR